MRLLIVALSLALVPGSAGAGPYCGERKKATLCDSDWKPNKEELRECTEIQRAPGRQNWQSFVLGLRDITCAAQDQNFYREIENENLRQIEYKKAELALLRGCTPSFEAGECSGAIQEYEHSLDSKHLRNLASRPAAAILEGFRGSYESVKANHAGYRMSMAITTSGPDPFLEREGPIQVSVSENSLVNDYFRALMGGGKIAPLSHADRTAYRHFLVEETKKATALLPKPERPEPYELQRMQEFWAHTEERIERFRDGRPPASTYSFAKAFNFSPGNTPHILNDSERAAIKALHAKQQQLKFEHTMTALSFLQTEPLFFHFKGTTANQPKDLENAFASMEEALTERRKLIQGEGIAGTANKVFKKLPTSFPLSVEKHKKYVALYQDPSLIRRVVAKDPDTFCPLADEIDTQIASGGAMDSAWKAMAFGGACGVVGGAAGGALGGGWTGLWTGFSAFQLCAYPIFTYLYLNKGAQEYLIHNQKVALFQTDLDKTLRDGDPEVRKIWESLKENEKSMLAVMLYLAWDVASVAARPLLKDSFEAAGGIAAYLKARGAAGAGNPAQILQQVGAAVKSDPKAAQDLGTLLRFLKQFAR